MANGHRDALVEALAGRLAEHARRVRHDTAEQIAAALRRAGIVGASIDAGHLVGRLPPAVGGLPGDAEIALTDDLGVELVDDDAVTLVFGGAYAPASHAHSGTVGRHEEFLPAAAATTVTLAATPVTVLIVARNGVVQSVASGHYSVAGAVLTFTTSFDGTQRVVVAYEV
jgi:hypothetical protein